MRLIEYGSGDDHVSLWCTYIIDISNLKVCGDVKDSGLDGQGGWIVR